MNLDNLGKIHRVEAPHFLYTRILQKIENQRKQRLSTQMAVAVGLSFVVILITNVMVFMDLQAATEYPASYAQSLHLISNNSLYK